MKNLPIYLDYAATTPVDKRVLEKMLPYFTFEGCFGNPNSTAHPYGWAAHEAVEHARQQVADLVNAQAREIIWTSGATEAINLALKGVASFYRAQGKHIITCKTEHKASLDTCAFLESIGFTVSYLMPQSNGLLSVDEIAAAIRPDTILISLMHVNNEIGVIHDITAIGELARKHNILFHVDAAQSAGKIPIDLQAMPIDLMSFSAHKVYGPKGIGALFVRQRPRARLLPLIHGGGHEQGLRSGTLATQQIVGMGAAFALAQQEMQEEAKRILDLRNRLWAGLKDLRGLYLNSDFKQGIPGILSISFAGVEGESLLLSLQGLAVSSGSACASNSLHPSHVIQALGRPDYLAYSTIRFSIGRFVTLDDINRTIKLVCEAVHRLRAISMIADY